MDREKIEKIINELDKISQKNYNDDFILALYVYVRFGIFEFNNYICKVSNQSYFKTKII